MKTLKKYILAVAQLAPVFLDKKATLEKTCATMDTAAREGAKMIVFPEAFLSAYPDWVWLVPAGKKAIYDSLYGELLENAISINGNEIAILCQTAKQLKLHVAIGINERNTESSNSSLYNTLVYISDKGTVIGKHRKMVPTGGERLIWAQGDGSTFEVYDTPFGRLGGLICWENYMPLARYSLYARGTELYLAPTWDSSEVWTLSMRHIAKEGGVFVVNCCMALHRDVIPERYEFKQFYAAEKDWINPGNSCVVNPKGQFIAGPVSKEETIFYSEIDRALIPAAKWILDVAGHYSRPDVFACTVNQKENPQLRIGQPE